MDKMGKNFLEVMGNKTIYVALIDSSAEDFSHEFAYQFRDWITQYPED